MYVGAVPSPTCYCHILFYRLVCSVGAEPSLFDLLKHVIPTIAAQWKMVGYALGVQHQVLNIVQYNERGVEDCAMELLARWLYRAPGTGDQPRTWHSVLGAVETVIGPGEKGQIEAKLQTLLSLSVFDDNCQRNVSTCMYVVSEVYSLIMKRPPYWCFSQMCKRPVGKMFKFNSC